MTALATRDRLSALEAAFLGLESRDVPFVHASILCFDRPIELDALRHHVAAALADLPRYHQRIDRRRLGFAAWVTDADYRIERQIQAATVAAPGGARELDDLAAHLLATELPADHPPWRLWVVDGVAGQRGAVISVFHHALIDGIAGFRLIEYVLGAHPTSAPGPAPAAEPPRGKLAAVRALASWDTLTGLARVLRDGLRPASQLGLNPRHTSGVRVVASHTVPRDAIAHIGHVFGATNNDVVLASVTGALRQTLIRRGVDPDLQDDVRAMVPVGRHPDHEGAPSGNRVVLLLAALPVDEGDPESCLRRVVTTTRALKRGHTAAGGELLLALSEATSPVLLTGVLRLALRLRAFNLLVTNVPGPRTELSLLGARLTRIVPIVNLWPHQSLGIAAASYAETMTFGIQADRDVIPDLASFRDDLAAAFEDLHAAAMRGSGPPRPRSNDVAHGPASHAAKA